jgi:hypothetical protein
MYFINSLKARLNRNAVVRDIERWAERIQDACRVAEERGDRDLALFCVHSADQLEATVDDMVQRGVL